MTVRELIEHLQKQDQDLPVCTVASGSMDGSRFELVPDGIKHERGDYVIGYVDHRYVWTKGVYLVIE
jgi:hypothetical protein